MMDERQGPAQEQEQPQGHPPRLAWAEGDVPVSTRFDDPYYSLADGAAESLHVFLQGNDLPARFRPGLSIAELGFGTGLNLLVTIQAWEQARVPGRLHFTSFEAWPLEPAAMARALARFASLAGWAQGLLAAWERGRRHFTLGPAEVEIIVGDARATLPRWPGRADAWFLDGFAPARNPELWEPALLREVARHTRPGGTVATYSAAGAVRRALEAAGFTIERRPGFGRKRHMLTGRLERRT